MYWIIYLKELNIKTLLSEIGDDRFLDSEITKLWESGFGWRGGCPVVVSLLHTADARAIFDSFDIDVSSVPPVCTPGVSEDEVFNPILITTVSNSGDNVVDFDSASGWIDNAAFISPERGLIGFNHDRDWSLSNGSLELSNRFFLNPIDFVYVDWFGYIGFFTWCLSTDISVVLCLG